MDDLRAEEKAAWHRRGAALVAAVMTIALVTAILTHEFRAWFVVMWAAGIVAVFALSLVLRTTPDRRVLLVWPVGIQLCILVCHFVAPQTAALIVGLVTTAFLSVGLTQRQWMSLPVAVPGVALYVTIVDLPFSQLMVRLCLALFTWICVAESTSALARGLRAAQHRLGDQAVTDDLTGLYNRRGWEERLEELVHEAGASGEPLSLVLIDIDHFKVYNDTYGHLRGDDLLRQLSLGLRRVVRPGDLVARWGGEEFGVALPGCPVADAQGIADRICGVIPDGQSCSAGLATFQPGETPRSLVHRADLALYEAKRRGRNQVVLADAG